MSMICYKGKVLTVDSNDTVAGFLVEDKGRIVYVGNELPEQYKNCLLYTSPSPRD